MNTRLITGIAGSSVGAFAVTEAVFKTIAGPRPPLDASAELVQYMASAAPWTLAVVLSDTVLMAALAVFFAGIATLIRYKRGTGFAVSLGMGAVLIFIAMTLAGDSMDGGTALDAGNADVIRTLIESHILLFGPIGSIFIALMTTAFAYALDRARIVERWAARLGYVVAVLNVLAVPMAFSAVGSMVNGGAIALTALVSLIVWITLTGALLLRKRA